MKEIEMNLTIKVTDETPVIYIEQIIGDALREDKNILDINWESKEK